LVFLGCVIFSSPPFHVKGVARLSPVNYEDHSFLTEEFPPPSRGSLPPFGFQKESISSDVSPPHPASPRCSFFSKRTCSRSLSSTEVLCTPRLLIEMTEAVSRQWRSVPPMRLSLARRADCFRLLLWCRKFETFSRRLESCRE